MNWHIAKPIKIDELMSALTEILKEYINFAADGGLYAEMIENDLLKQERLMEHPPICVPLKIVVMPGYR